ncbi:MAG: 4Fe-4S dicluster domain-containing protein [Gaiellaceae bacterium]
MTISSASAAFTGRDPGNRLYGPVPDVSEQAGYEPEHPKRVGFFTDTSVCIGCKACEVACKEWNLVPEDGLVWTGESYDNTSTLGANTWRHVAFVEQNEPLRGDGDVDALRWLMSSDVCKHCTHAACLDVCPTGALFRTEYGTVVVQEDVCNGCGYCVPACPFGVLDKRHIPRHSGDPPAEILGLQLGKAEDGRVWKCTLCYDRLKGGHEPACAKACPTDSIQFGPLDELRERASKRLEKLQAEDWNGARLYGHDPEDGVGGFGAFFLLLDEPEVYGLPPDPVVTTSHLAEMWKTAAVATGALVLGVVAGFVGGSR